MKISLNWLKDYIKTDLSAEQISKALTDIGLEVEGYEVVESIRGGLEGVVVGHVLTKEKHPDADKLNITTVDIGTGTPLQIVCGAPNVDAGQKVVVATVGCTLYPTGEAEGFKIKKSKIRGVESLGMICAEDEIGIGTDHDGIMVLDSEATIGMAAKEYFNFQDDVLMEIGLTPNRIDAGSHYGVARDLAAYLKYNKLEHELILPEVTKLENPSVEGIKIEVENSDAAPKYMGITIRGIEVKPSPEWLQTKLRAIGLNPINNIVDITNFILFEFGQPLHAFDASKIEGGKIVVRTCDNGADFTTLDGVERKLSDKDLMICNAVKPMCIAGVFGGLDSGVTAQTKDIFIESAYFNPVWVRKTAKRHGLSTDASFRYERGIDPNSTMYGLLRAAMLVLELAGGQYSAIETGSCKEFAPFEFDFSIDRAQKLIGKQIAAEDIKTIIEALEIEIKEDNDGVLKVAVPQYRVDVQREADLVEDVLRIYGYNNIEIPQQVKSTLSYAPNPDKDKAQNTISNLLSANGFYEIMSNSLTKASYYDALSSYKAENCVKILNPLSNELSVMRQSLIFNALEAVALNASHRNPNLKMYEFGNCYSYNAEKQADGGLKPYSQQARLAVFITGNSNRTSWNTKALRGDFFTLKAAAEKIVARFGVDLSAAVCEPLESDLYSEAVSFKVHGKRLFEMGVVSKKLRGSFDIKADVYYLEMNFDAMLTLTKSNKVAVKELAKYPDVRRDLAMLVDKSVSFAKLRSIAFATEKKLLKSVSLFDVYEGDKLPEGKKSYALNFVLSDASKTLTDSDIERSMSSLISQFERQVGAQIRS